MKAKHLGETQSTRWNYTYDEGAPVGSLEPFMGEDASGPLIYTLPADGLLLNEVRELREKLDALRERFELSQRRTVFLGALDHKTYRLRIPLAVELTESDGTYAAFSADLEVFAEGGDELTALAALRAAVVEDFEYLANREESLGPGPAAQLARFREIVEIA
jgi:hypothetical protein